MPLNFDLSYAELEHYRGSSPRPDDFDEYWDRALADLDSTTPDVELTPAEFQAPYAECFHLTFTGTGDARVHAKLLRPTTSGGRRPAVLFFHGYGADSGNWTEKLPYVALGYTVAALDCRGQAGLSEDATPVRGWTLRSHLLRGIEDHPDNLLYRHIYLDTVRLARVVMAMDQVDPDRVGVTGRSQGGGLAVACAALEPRIRMAAPVYPFLSDYRRAWDMDLQEGPYDEIAEFFRRRDPLHRREAEVFERLGYIDVQHLAPRVAATTQMTIALGDRVCPPSTQFALYNRLTCEKTLRTYPDFGHEQLPETDDAIFTLLKGL